MKSEVRCIAVGTLFLELSQMAHHAMGYWRANAAGQRPGFGTFRVQWGLLCGAWTITGQAQPPVSAWGSMLACGRVYARET